MSYYSVHTFRGGRPLGVVAVCCSMAFGLMGCGSDSPLASGLLLPPFQVTRLVSDTAAGGGAVVDPDLVNPWGVSFSPTHPFWISDNGTGRSTLYNGAGAKQALVVSIPGPGGTGSGAVTGQVFNATSNFVLPAGAPGAPVAPAFFIFATEDGTIEAWNSLAGRTAVQTVDNSSRGAVYKGLAAGSIGGANFLYATDFHNGRVDVFDGSFQPASATVLAANAFVDPVIPAGFAPFGIANIAGSIYVSYAMQNAAGHDDVPGAGNGFVDIFQPNGAFVRRMVSRGPLNSPWAMVIAPSGFGTAAGNLLVGNFGDGTVSAFNASTGAFLGTLRDTNGNSIVLEGLWALIDGTGALNAAPGTLYFTAGIGQEKHGLFGTISLAGAAR